MSGKWDEKIVYKQKKSTDDVGTVFVEVLEEEINQMKFEQMKFDKMECLLKETYSLLVKLGHENTYRIHEANEKTSEQMQELEEEILKVVYR